MPSEFALAGPRPETAAQQPTGPAIAAYLTDNDEDAWWVFVGATGSSYRRHAGYLSI